MKSLTPRLAPFLLLWVPLALAGLGLGAVVEFMRASEALQREGTTLHRIVSQRAEQHDAHLTSLAAVLASSNAESASFRAVIEAMQRFYPRIAAVELVEDRLVGPAIGQVGRIDRKAEKILQPRGSGPGGRRFWRCRPG